MVKKKLYCKYFGYNYVLIIYVQYTIYSRCTCTWGLWFFPKPVKKITRNKNHVIFFLNMNIQYFLFKFYRDCLFKTAGSDNFFFCIFQVKIVFFSYNILWQKIIKNTPMVSSYCASSDKWILYIWQNFFYKEYNRIYELSPFTVYTNCGSILWLLSINLGKGFCWSPRSHASKWYACRPGRLS